MARNMYYLSEFSCELDKDVYSAVVGWASLYSINFS